MVKNGRSAGRPSKYLFEQSALAYKLYVQEEQGFMTSDAVAEHIVKHHPDFGIDPAFITGSLIRNLAKLHRKRLAATPHNLTTGDQTPDV